MSHFTTLKTQITDLGCLKSALNHLNFAWEEGDCTVNNYLGESEPVDLAIRTGTKYDIGFRRAGNEYEIVADWWGVENSGQLKEKETVDGIRQRYAYEKIMKEQEKLRKQGFLFAKHEVTEEKVEVITLRRY